MHSSEKKIGSPILIENMWMTDKPGKMKRKVDCYTVLGSVANIWQLIGNFPIYFTDSAILKKCAFSKIIMTYQVGLFCTSLGFISSGLYAWEDTLGMQSLVMSTTMMIRTVSSVSTVLITIAMWLFYHKDFIDAVDFLASQSLILNQLGCRPNYVTGIRIIRACVYGALTIIIVLFGYNFYANQHIYPSTSLLGACRWFFWNVPVMAQVVTPTIFMSLVMFLGFNFRELNAKLMAIIERNNTASLKVDEVSNECAEHVRLIAKAHYNLCKIARFINWIFSGVFVIIVVTAFIILSSSLYFIFIEVVKESETDYISIGTYISWQITHAVPIITTVIICNWTSNEAAYTGKLIHEIHVDSTESKLYQIIRSLSLQLHHQKIEFSGAGLFPINSSLLQTMIGNMTTSLVILIQFQPPLEYN